MLIYFCTFDINTTVSTVLPKTHKTPDSYINVSVDFGVAVGMIPLNSIVEKAQAYKPKPKTTYKIIKEYILEKYSFKIHTAYIAEVKRDLGLPMYWYVRSCRRPFVPVGTKENGGSYPQKGARRVAIYHCSIKVISRGKGKSAVAAAAYRNVVNLRLNPGTLKIET